MSGIKDLLLGFEPIKPKDVPTIHRYYEAYSSTRKYPRFYMSTLWLGAKSEFVFGVVDNCLCIVKCKVLFGKPVIYLILPPMDLDGSIDNELSVLKRFYRAGIGAKLSSEDVDLYDIRNRVVEDMGNAEYVYRVGDYANLSGKYWKKWRIYWNAVSKYDVSTYTRTTPYIVSKCRGVSSSWGRVRGVSIKDHIRVMGLFNSFASNSDCFLFVVDVNGVSCVCGVSQRVSSSFGCLLLRPHVFGSLSDTSKIAHLIEARHWAGVAGSDMLLNAGAAIRGGEGLERTKEKLRPIKVLQLYTLKPSKKLTLQDYHDAKAEKRLGFGF